MLLPSYTVRNVLKWVTVFAMFCLVLARAVQGDFWAIAASVAVVSLCVVLLSHVSFYLMVSLLARLFGRHPVAAHTRQGGVQLDPDKQVLPE